jgi:hypothetical protein
MVVMLSRRSTVQARGGRRRPSIGPGIFPSSRGMACLLTVKWGFRRPTEGGISLRNMPERPTGPYVQIRTWCRADGSRQHSLSPQAGRRIMRHLACLQRDGLDPAEGRCADPGSVSALEGSSVWRVVVRSVSSPSPSTSGTQTAWSVRGVDRDEVSGDRIKNGHGAVLCRSGTGGTRHAWVGSGSIVVVVTRLLTRSDTRISKLAPRRA